MKGESSEDVSVQRDCVYFSMCYLVWPWSPRFEGKLMDSGLLLALANTEKPSVQNCISGSLLLWLLFFYH